jgi:hypothetical protein
MVNGPLPGIRHGRTAMPLTFGSVLGGHKAWRAHLPRGGFVLRRSLKF